MRKCPARATALFSMSSHFLEAPPIRQVIRRSDASATNSWEMKGTIRVRGPKAKAPGRLPRRPETLAAPWLTAVRFDAMRLYALVEAGDPEAIDVYLCEQDAQRALEDCLRDEPDWRGLLPVQEIEFAGTL